VKFADPRNRPGAIGLLSLSVLTGIGAVLRLGDDSDTIRVLSAVLLVACAIAIVVSVMQLRRSSTKR
jgi:hypothetical protein